MLLNQGFWTLASVGRFELQEKKSLFLGEAFSVHTAEEAQKILAEIKKREISARHWCYAYRLGGQNSCFYQKFSDDGEPKGTAGKPILDILEGQDLRDVLVVVTRYFGGILLGTGGLVRAYSTAASEAVRSAGLLWMEHQLLQSCVLPYTQVESFCYAAEKMGAKLQKTVYAEDVSLVFAAPDFLWTRLTALLQERTAGRCTWTECGGTWVPEERIKK